jgi:DNA recombination protein RmuC
VLVKVKRQLNTAANTIGETERRSRAMERKLRSVESLPEAEASEVLQLSEPLDFEVLSAADALAGDDDEVLA